MDFLPDAIQLGPLPLAIHVLTGALGALIGYLLSGWSARRAGMQPEPMQDVILNLLIGGILGAKLLYILLDPAGYVRNPSALLLFPFGPLALPAGLIGGALLAAWGLRKNSGRLQVLDQLALPLSVGLAVALLGWKGPGTWAFAPLLALAALLSHLGWKESGRPGLRSIATLVLVSAALVVADLFRPAGATLAGVSWLQTGAALAGTAGWLWIRRLGSTA